MFSERGQAGRPVLLGITYLLAVGSYLPAQTSNAPVVVAEKNVAELQKTRAVLVINGADGQHPPPEADLAATAQFTRAISEQLEHLTCWKVLPRTSAPKSRPGETSTSLMTYVEYKEVPYARYTTPYHAVFQFTVRDSNGTLWAGSKEIEPPRGNQGFYTPAEIQSVATEMLGALGKDACPGWEPLRPASFDCAKAVTRTEKLICASPELSNADGVMAAGYRKTVGEARAIFPDAAEEFKQDQLRWIKENATCKEAACLQKRYGERIAFIEEYASVTAAGGTANDEATAAFLRHYPWEFRYMPRLMKEVRGLLGSEYELFKAAMEHVYVDNPTDPSHLIGSPMHPLDLRCALEAILSVTAGGRVAVGVTDGGKANVISIFSAPGVTRLEELPKVQSWVEGMQKNCGKWEVKLR